jgi:hypothetical protein
MKPGVTKKATQSHTNFINLNIIFVNTQYYNISILKIFILPILWLFPQYNNQNIR